MRTLTSTQLAAQAGLSAIPIVRVQRRPASCGEDRFALGEAIGWSLPGVITPTTPTACAARAGTMTIYAIANGSLRRIPFTGNPPVQGVDSVIAANTDTLIAAAANATSTAVITWAAGNDIKVYIDSGSGFAAPEACTILGPIYALATAFDADGSLYIVAQQQSNIGVRLRTDVNLYNALVQSAIITMTAQNGVACSATKAQSPDDLAIVHSATITGISSIQSLVFGHGDQVPIGTFTSPTTILQAPPYTALLPGTIFTVGGMTIADTLRWTVLEDFQNQPAPFTTKHAYIQSALSAQSFKLGFAKEPTPLGLVPSPLLQKPAYDRTTGRLWFANASNYTYADGPITVDHSARVLRVTTKEEENQGSASVILDNSDGGLNALLGPDTIGQKLTIEFGYHTSVGDEYSTPAAYWVSAVHALSHDGWNLVELACANAWHLLATFRPRRLQSFDKNTLTISQMLQWLVARIGQGFANAGSPSVSIGTTPAFLFQPAATAAHAVHELLDQVPEVLRFTPGGAVLTNPLTTDAAVYTYTPSNHPIVTCRSTTLAQAINHVLLFGNATATATVPTLIAESYDYNDAARITDFTHAITDRQVTLASAALRTAAALRKAQLITDAGEIAGAPNIGLELWDVVSLTHPGVGWTNKLARVRAIHTHFDRMAEGGVFTQSVGLQNR